MAKLIVLLLISSAALLAQANPQQAPRLNHLLTRFRNGNPTGSYAHAAASAGAGTSAHSKAAYNSEPEHSPVASSSHSGAHAAAEAFAGLDAANSQAVHQPIHRIEPLPKVEVPNVPVTELGVAPPPPEKPVVDLNRFKPNNLNLNRLQSRFAKRIPTHNHAYATAHASAGSRFTPDINKFAHQKSYGPNAHAQASAGVTGATESHVSDAGNAFADASAGVVEAPETVATNSGNISDEETNFHYEEPEEVSEAVAAAGTYTGDNVVHETSGYQRSTEDNEQQEDGKSDDNHYYNAQSYSKADDESKKENYSKGEEETEQSATLYKSKKSNENYNLDYAKQRRETGSGVLAKDRSQARFNKRTRNFRERVDQNRNRVGAGIEEHVKQSRNDDFDDEDEEIFDSDGFKPKQQVSLHANGAARTGSAAASASITKH